MVSGPPGMWSRRPLHFLWPQVRREYDNVHVQDPTTGKILDHLHRLGLSRPRVILANSTDESVEWLSHLSVVQELSPDAASPTGTATRRCFGAIAEFW